MGMPTSMLSSLVASTSVSSWLAQKPAWPLRLPSPVLPHGL